jgi:hypothetical protein
MRSILYSLLSLATIASTLAIETPAAKATTKNDDWEEKAPDTTFNGETVPPMIELRTDNIDTEISKGNWYAAILNIQGTMLTSEQDSRVLLALLRALQALQAHLPDRI